MKLIYRIFLQLSLVLSVIFALWAVFFYIAVMNEVNDEIDDSLEDYAEQIILRFLAGEEIPSTDLHSNNQYYLREISAEYAITKPGMDYKDSMVYIPHKRETEPARILTTIYKDKEGKYYELVISSPSIEKGDLKQAILYWLFFLYVGLLVVILVVNLYVYYSSNRPLYKLLTWLSEYKVGGKNIPLCNDTEITEFKRLNEVILDTMERAEKIFEEQKQFIGNASHEIQTPLAVCCNRIETLLDDESLTEKQMEELVKTYTMLEYISKLNKSLLLLTRIDNRQFANSDIIELNRIITKLVPDYEEVYSHMHIQTYICEKGKFQIKIHEMLAHILLNNLIKNGYVHNKEQGQFLIEISCSKIVFRNTGQAYPLNSKLIYERFYQGNRKSGCMGLGLSLVKSICDMQGLILSYYFEDSFHCFEISLEKN